MADDGFVGVGEDLCPGVLLAAYRSGCFPWPVDAVSRIPWFCPDPRAVLPVDAVHVSRSLRARLRRCGWSTTLDVTFPPVVAGCAARPQTWITAELAAAYVELHRAGHAHSVEVWSGDGRLVGGIYGVLVGRIFSGESMFHRETDASKVALVDLAVRVRQAGGWLIDAQEQTGHLTSLGAVLLDRPEFLALLVAGRDAPVHLDRQRHPVTRLADEGRGYSRQTSTIARSSAALGAAAVTRRSAPPANP